ncbi:MAG TPA: hypothetical protein VE173_14810, partial [Longimicrobiales bacterium]|nr:hypothetical protein [Longimicrobiales bacterium]
PDRSPLSSRIVTLGGEAWLGPAWLLSATVYHRSTRGLVLPDPTPGLVVQRSPLVEGRVRARGVDVSLRRLAGRVTGSLAYSLGDARARGAGLDFPAPTDRRHVIDVTMETRLTRGLDLAAAWVLATGAPYTRTLERCVGEGCRPAALLDRPFGRRSPTYRSLDLVLDWTHRFGSWSVGGFLQARNVLGHDNAVTYTNTEESCIGGVFENGVCSGGGRPSSKDAFTPGIPTIPLLGLRVTF